MEGLTGDDRQAFLAAVADKPLDHLLRCVFADWLDEHGEVEEATRQRAWVGAYEYLLQNFVDPDWEEEFDDPRPDFAAVTRTLEYWADLLLEDDGICFGTVQAAENLYDEKNHAEFYRTLEVVTGVKIVPEVRERASFHCAC